MITKLTPEQVRDRRKYYLTNANKVTKIDKGDRRVSGTRICAICQTQLSTVILATGKRRATRAHFHCYFSELLYVNICKDSANCQRVTRNREEEI